MPQQQSKAAPPVRQPDPPLKIGDPIQWTIGGVDQFAVPVPVESISACGRFCFVAGTATGLPVSQCTVIPARPPKPPPAHIADVNLVPIKLRQAKRWVPWKWVWIDDKKWDKPPVDALGDAIDQTDPANWLAFEQARRVGRKIGDGAGIALGPKDNRLGIVGIDLDNCIDAAGTISAEASKIVVRFDSYTERTPSGNGLRILIWGDKPGPRCKTSSRPGIELYESDRYLTVTGRHLEGTPTEIHRRDDALKALYDEMFAGKPGLPPAAGTQPSGPVNASDDELIEKARQARNGAGAKFARLFDQGDVSAYAGDDSAADMALTNMLAFWTGRDFNRMEAIFGRSALGQRDKWRNRADYRQRTIDKAIDDCAKVYTPQPARSGSGGAKFSANGAGHHPASPDPLNLTDWGNARRLIAAHGHRLRYCKPLGQWYEWDGTRWSPDQTGAIWRWAKDTVRQLGREAADTADDQRRQATLKWALKSEEKKVMGSMIELAWSEPGVSILPDAFDCDPWVLNTPAGTVNLKTGRLEPHRQTDLISKITSVPFGPDAKCPKWEKTLGEIFAGDDAMVAYVQRALGYSLTGFIGEHALFLCYGTGRNGKNTVLDTVATILSDYATVANPRTFLTVGQNDHLAMIADLMGRRFVPTDEVEEGEQLAESMVKRLTGNKTLKARFMHKNPFEFTVLFKVWMLANCKPEIQGQDEGIWSRIRLIPFEVYFPPEKRTKGLSDILIKEEGPGILKWLVDGCLEWQRIGLAEPEKVLNAVKEYRSEQNVLMDFIGQCADSFLDNEALREVAKEKTSNLYERYVAWCKENGEKKVLTSRKFGLKLTPLGYKPHENNGASYRLGLRLKSKPEPFVARATPDEKPY
jgi:putative DNA primase/helicase